jgi:prepilin peptidase CpaA
MPTHHAVKLLLLSAILALAVHSDLRRHRIPNVLTLLGLIAGLGLQAVTGGVQGLLSGLLGVAVGLGSFAPLYLCRAMGAGDLKLLAAVGAFLGPQGAFLAALFTLLAGGLGAIGYVLWRALRASVGSFVREGLGSAVTSAFVATQVARRDRLPFALPIAFGGLAACWYLADFSGGPAWLRGATL